MNRNEIPLVLPLGCPRAGTSLLYQMCLRLRGVEVRKLGETLAEHPCNSPYGMQSLVRLFRGRQVVFINVKRDMTDVIQSFYACKTPTHPNKRMGANTPKSIARFIARSTYNVENQRERISREGGVLLDVEFANLQADCEKIAFAAGGLEDTENVKRLQQYGEMTIDKRSVRAGVMWVNQQPGLECVVATEKEVQAIKTMVDELNVKNVDKLAAQVARRVAEQLEKQAAEAAA